MAEKSIILEKVSKSFGGFTALEGLSLSLRAGHFYGLLGLSGAGKTTLLRILASLEDFSEGAGEVLGSPLGKEPSSIYSGLALVSEETAFDTDTPLRELVTLRKRLYPTWDEKLWRDLSTQFELLEESAFRTFSRGKKMQAQFCLALACKPQVLLLDEPTAVMDPAARIAVMERCKELSQRGSLVLLATGLVMELEAQIDHLLILHQGRLVYDHAMGDVGETFKKIRTKDPYLHPVFRMPSCAPLLMNQDGTRSYLIPKDRLLQLSSEPGPEFQDRRAITPYEVFLYFTRKPPTEDSKKEAKK